jgi:hypothetical protein
MRVRNFAAPNEPLNIKKKYIYILTPKSPSYRDLWCKNHENPSDQNLKLGHLKYKRVKFDLLLGRHVLRADWTVVVWLYYTVQ